jgi:hypothetical protein
VRHPIDVQGLSAAARAGLHGLVSTLVRERIARNVTIISFPVRSRPTG